MDKTPPSVRESRSGSGSARIPRTDSRRMSSSRQSLRPPVIILVTDSVVQDDRKDGVAPLALRELHGKPLIDHWWACLEAVGLNLQTHLFLATNAVNYKHFEFWAHSKGVPTSHILNSGSSLGDDVRVDWRTVARALHVAAKRVARDESSSIAHPHDALIIAADSAPPHVGTAFQGTLSALLRSGRSSFLLQPPHNSDGPGPLVTTSPAGWAVVARCEGGSTVPGGSPSPSHIVKDVLSGSAAALEFAPVPGSTYSCMPLVVFLPADVLGNVDSSAVLRDIARVHDAKYLIPCEEASAPLDPLAEFKAAEVRHSISLEDVLARVARTTEVLGVRISDKFQIGANDGSYHGIPSAVRSAPQQSISPARMSVMSSSGLFAHEVIHTRAYGRVGLCGNPSDGYGGKTFSVTIANFYADAWLTPAKDSSVTLVPHPLYDASSFVNLRQLSAIAEHDGYSGGLRLLHAMLHRFFLHCRVGGITLPERGFSLRYHTIVPRQVGLAGSSAILTAALRALLQFYGYGAEERAASIGLGRDKMPSFILSVESDELSIAAGLQDRVVQSYEGAVHMDFTPALLAAQGQGTYTRVPTAALPPLFLAYAAEPSDSGRIHAPIKQRWLAGDPEIVASMSSIAAVADSGFALSSSRPYGAAATVAEHEDIAHEWANLFSRNFELRLGMFGEAALGTDNMAMIGIAKAMGAAAKFPGSGGAVVGVVDVAGMVTAGTLTGVLPEGEGSSTASRVAAASVALMEAYHAKGYVYVRLQPVEPSG